MPNRWPIADGNWSDSAIWSGSIIPTASDDVYANNRIVNIDTNIQVLSLRNASGTGITQGGRFEIYGNYNISASAITATSHVSATPVTLGPGLVTYYGTGSATIIVANLTSSTHGPTLFNSSSGTVNILGNVAAPYNVTTVSTMVINGNTGTINVIGNVTSPSVANAQNYGLINSLTGTINVTGNVVGGSSNGVSPTILNSSFGTINVTGNVLGSPTSLTVAQSAISQTSTGLVNITGTVVGDRASGVSSTSAGTIIVRGPISSSIITNGISSTSTTSTNIFTGPFYNTGSFNAVYAYRMQIIDPASTSWRFDTETTGVSKTLYTANQLPGVPQQSDVRKGVQYNFGLTGSLEMPDPTTVKLGVAVDNTVGSAVLTAQDMFDVLTQDIVQTGSIGETLDNVSTVQTVAATVSAFKV
jgi:hypothetical protein